MWGDGGAMPLMKTGMIVGYQPQFRVESTDDTVSNLKKRFPNITGIRIGPLTFSTVSDTEPASMTFTENDHVFSGGATSNIPVIIGVIIETLPNN